MLAAAAYIVLSKIFPGTTEYVEVPPQPVTTGNAEIDALFRAGETAVAGMKHLRSTLPNKALHPKTDELVDVPIKFLKM